MDKHSDDHDLSTNTLVPINDPSDHIIEENNYTIEHTSDGPAVINMPDLSCDLEQPKKLSTLPATTFPASVADIPLPGEVVDEIPLPPVSTSDSIPVETHQVPETVSENDSSTTIDDSTVNINESNGSITSCNLQLHVSNEDQDPDVSMESIEGAHVTGSDDMDTQEITPVSESKPEAEQPIITEIPVVDIEQPAPIEQEVEEVVEQPRTIIAAQEELPPTEVVTVEDEVPQISVLKMEDEEVEEIVGDYSTAPLAVKKDSTRKSAAQQKKKLNPESAYIKQAPPPAKPVNQKTLNDITAEAIMDEEEVPEESLEEPDDTILPHNTKHAVVSVPQPQPVVVAPQQPQPVVVPKKQAAIVQQQVVAAAGEDGKPVYYLETVDEDGVVVMQEAALVVEGEEDDDEEDGEEGQVRLVQMQEEEEEDEDADYQESENIQLYITSDDISDEIDSQSSANAKNVRDIIPSHFHGRTVNAPSRDSVKNGKSAPKPRLGVKVPYKNLTSQIVSKAEITEAIMERSMRTSALRTATMQQDYGSRSPSGLNLFSKKMTRRLVTKISPDDEDDEDDPEQGPQAPLAKKKAYVGRMKGASGAVGSRAADGGSGTEDLLAILEGNEDDKGHLHHPTAALIPATNPISIQRVAQQLTAAEERAIALKQLEAIDSDSEDEVEDIRSIQATLKRHHAATGGQMPPATKRISGRETKDAREAREAAATLQRQNRTNSQSSSTSSTSDGKTSSAARVVGSASKVVVQSVVEPSDGGTPVKRPRGRPKKLVPQPLAEEEEEVVLQEVVMLEQEVQSPAAANPTTVQKSPSASQSKNAEKPAESPRTTITRVNSEPEPTFASHVPLKTYARKRKPSETGAAPSGGAKGEYDFVEETNSDKAGEEVTPPVVPEDKNLPAKLAKIDERKKEEKNVKDKESSKKDVVAKTPAKKLHHDTPKKSTETPKKDETTKSSKRNEDDSKTPRKIEEQLPKSSKKIEEAPKTPKKLEEATKTSKKIEEVLPKSSKKSEEVPKAPKKIEDAPKTSKKLEEPPKSTKKLEDSKTPSKKLSLEETPSKKDLSKSSLKKIDDQKTPSNKKEEPQSSTKDKKKDLLSKSSTKSLEKDKEKSVEKTPTIPPTMHMTKSARVIKKKVIWDPDDAGSPLKPPLKTFSSSASTSSTTSSSGSIGEKEKEKSTPAKVERKIKSTDSNKKEENIKKVDKEKVVDKEPKKQTANIEIDEEIDDEKLLDTSAKTEDLEEAPATAAAVISPTKKRKLNEVAKLLKDEGAINMLYSLKSNQNDDAESGNARSSRRNRDFLGKASDLYEDLTTISSMESPKALRKKAGPIIHEKKKRSLAAPLLARKKSGDSFRSSNHSAPASPQHVGNAASFGADASRIIRRRSSSSFGSLEDAQGEEETEEDDEELTEEGETEGSVIDLDKDDTLKSNTEATPASPNNQPDKDKDKPPATINNNNNRRKQPPSPAKPPISPKRQKISINPNLAESERMNVVNAQNTSQQANEREVDNKKDISLPVEESTTTKDKVMEVEEEEGEEEVKETVDLAAMVKNWEGEMVMENDFVRMTQRENVWRITLLEGEKFDGRLNFEILKQLTTLLTDLETNDKCHVVVLTATTKSFCTGLNFTTLFNQNEQIALRNSTELAFIIRKFLIALVKFPKPLVAGIRGGSNCGLGCTMLPLFDLVISADTATFSACADALSKSCSLIEGGSLLTGANVTQRALVSELLFVGGKLTGAQALRYGLVTRLVWPKNFDAELHRTVCNIATHSLEFLKSTKKQTRHHTIATIVDLIKAETDTLIKHWTSADCQQQFQQLQQQQQLINSSQSTKKS